MGKLIAVCGSPNSGKTTLSMKVAKSIYDISMFFGHNGNNENNGTKKQRAVNPRL